MWWSAPLLFPLVRYILSPTARTRASPSCVVVIVLSASRCPRTFLVWLISVGLSVGSGTAASSLFTRSARRWATVAVPAPWMVCVVAAIRLVIMPVPVAIRPCPVDPTAPAPATPTAVSVGAADVSASYLPGVVDVSAVAEVEMSDEDFVPSKSDVKSDALVVRTALHPPPSRSPRRRRKRRRHAVSSTPPLEPVDMDLSVEGS